MSVLASITGNSATDCLHCTDINDSSESPGKTVELCSLIQNGNTCTNYLFYTLLSSFQSHLGGCTTSFA